MSRQLTALLIGAGARGAMAYAPYALQFPEKIQFIAVAEPDHSRRQMFAQQHRLPENAVFTDYHQMLAAGINADIVLVCTQDKEHIEPALMALDKGYHILVEKPISPSRDECLALQKKVEQTGLSATVCHVLRYTPFFRKIREILQSGGIGDLVSITHNENVGYYHAAHSYVRGNWRNEATSSPMLLAKSCHDIDILLWLVGERCTKVSSFGGLKHFCAANAPQGSTAYCSGGCQVFNQCPFNAYKIYSDPLTAHIGEAVFGDKSVNEIRKELQAGQYGRCVYHCDNDVVDHQATIMEFKSGVTASFHMNSLSYDISRTIQLCGTKGEIKGRMEDEYLMLHSFLDHRSERIDIGTPTLNGYGHGGGDFALMESLVDFLNGTGDMASSVAVSVESHLICFAAETARKTNQVMRF